MSAEERDDLRVLKQRLAAKALDACQHLWPNGKLNGHEWYVGNLQGEPGDSFRINCKTGAWMDFATGEKGGNLLDAWNRLRGHGNKLSRSVVLEAMAFVGMESSAVSPPTEAPRLHPGDTNLREGSTVQKYLTEARGLSLETLRTYGVMEGSGVWGGQTFAAYVLPAKSADGNRLEYVKRIAVERPDGGKKRVVTNKNPHWALWGKNVVDAFGPELIIVEGELDAMSWYQAGLPAVSVPNGTHYGGWLEREREYLGKFGRILIAFDNDEAGRKGAEELARAIGIERTFILDLTRHKDANEALVAGDVDAFLAAYNSPRKLEPESEETDGLNHEEIPDFAESGSNPIGDTRKPFDCYYDSDRKEYLIQNPDGRWMSQNIAQIKRRLRAGGFSVRVAEGEQLSLADRFMLGTEDHYDVRYAAPLAGRTAGFYEENGQRILVTESPRLIEPKAGDWRTLRAVIEGLLAFGEPEHGQRQLDTFYGWLKTGRETLGAGKHQHGQALALAGPVDCGKSLLQKLITHFLGGRAAKAVQFMTGVTPFNAELFEAEHLMLEDEFMSTRITDRLKLGASIKSFTVSTDLQSCHRKNRTPVQLRPWWRVSISLNDDSEALRVLPPLNEDIADKIILLRASRFDMPMPTDTTETRELFWRTLQSEIPAFLDWLLNCYTIPEHLRNRRYIVSTFQHPELVEALDQLSPEAHLLGMIDAVLFEAGQFEWTGTAEELRQCLVENSATQRDAEHLLEHANVTGTYLGRLAKRKPDRVSQDRSNSKRGWRVHRP